MPSKIESYSQIASKVESIDGFMVRGQDSYLFQKIQSLPNDAVILEIGAFKGRSTVNMAYACVGTQRKIYSLDTWAGNDKDFHITDYEDTWKKNIILNRVENYVTPIKGHSQESLKNWENLSGGEKIDFIFIDGSHVLEDVFKDFQLSFPWLKVGGWVAFHDVEYTHHDVVRIWNEVAYPVLTNHEYSATISCGQKEAESSVDLFLLTGDKLSKEINKTCFFVDTYYEAFINSFYQKNPELVSVPYQQQIDSIHYQGFGDSDFYSKGLCHQGWKSSNIISNCQQVQGRWLLEADWDLNQYHIWNIMVSQIRKVMPEVVYFQDLSVANKDVIESIRPFTKLIVGQIASPIPKTAYLKGIDIIFTSFPHYVDLFRQQGIIAYYQPLAFSPQILDKITTGPRDLDLTFIGGISGIHGKGTEFLNHVSSHLAIDIFGYGVDSLPSTSPIRKRHRGETWGLDMFNLFSRSLITLNRHVDVAENNANNMRLFEATGCGALLITDYKDNLDQLFNIGEEVIAYRSLEECVALVHYFLRHPEEAKEIAEAGQRRTLSDHTYDKRMAYTAEILERHLRYQDITYELEVAQNKVAKNLFSDYYPASSDDMTPDTEFAWTDETLPVYQRQIVQKELESLYSGNTIPIFDSLISALTYILHDSMSVIDIGCASGYYSEVIDYLFPYEISYTGIDHSEHLVEMAKDLYPSAKIEIGNGVNIPYPDQSYTISLSSAVLLHVDNISSHIAEMCRVSEKFVILNRTDVVKDRDSQYFRKIAYGVQMTEVWYNEEYLVDLFLSQGFKKIHSIEVESNHQTDHYVCTYIFERSSVYRPSTTVNYNESNLETESVADERWKQLPPLLSLELIADLVKDFERLDRQMKSLGKKQVDMQIFNRIFNQWIQTLDMNDAKKWFLQNLAAQGGQHILGVRDRINIGYSYLQERLSDLINWLIFSKESDNFTYNLTPLNMKHLAWVLVTVTGKSYNQVRGVISELVNDVQLKNHIIEWAKKINFPYTLDPAARYGRRILWYVLVRILKPEVVVESGVHHGLGSCVLSAAIMKNRNEGFKGELYTVDIVPESGGLVQAPYKEFVNMTVENSLDFLRSFNRPINLFIHDSDHSAQHELEEYQIISDKLLGDSVIISDNAHATDILPTFAAETGRLFSYFQEFPIHHFYPGAGAGIAYKPRG